MLELYVTACGTRKPKPAGGGPEGHVRPAGARRWQRAGTPWGTIRRRRAPSAGSLKARAKKSPPAGHHEGGCREDRCTQSDRRGETPRLRVDLHVPVRTRPRHPPITLGRPATANRRRKEDRAAETVRRAEHPPTSGALLRVRRGCLLRFREDRRRGLSQRREDRKEEVQMGKKRDRSALCGFGVLARGPSGSGRTGEEDSRKDAKIAKKKFRWGGIPSRPPRSPASLLAAWDAEKTRADKRRDELL